MDTGKRVPHVAAMVEYFDQIAARAKGFDSMSAEERYSLLKNAEREAILGEFEECADNFEYAAHNYFWITNKYGVDQLFFLWESQALVLQKYYELKAKGKPQKLIILKARQLGVSLLAEAMIAWRTMFFPNTEAIVVSVDADHSKYLFSLMLHIYDMMPWWLKPQAASLKYEEGLHFDNPDRDQRRLRPGLNSKIYVQHSNQASGVGQGMRISAAHVSEFADWIQSRAQEVIEGDLLHAIHDNPNNFAFLESTGRGAGTYSHMLWRANEKLLEKAEWHPVFLPWFFEASRSISLPERWKLKRPEAMMRERVRHEWTRCSNPTCSQFQTSLVASANSNQCPSCRAGDLSPYSIPDEQLAWKEEKRINSEAKGKEALKKHREEMACTAEESWQLSGISVFDEATVDMVNQTLIDPNKSSDVKRGYIDQHGRFHGVKGGRGGCYVAECKANHRFDDVYFWVWEMPKPGMAYSIGVDVSEGIGEDSSVVWVNKVGGPGRPDEQVAVLRSNEIEPYDLAFYVNVIGRMYNDALVAIEYNTYTTTGDRVRMNFCYPNLYRWKNLESINPLTMKWHWYTQLNSKPKLWQTGRKWLKSGNWIIRDPVFLTEMQTFQKDEDDSRRASHERGAHDDVLMAGLIALYCSHDIDADDQGNILLPTEQNLLEPARYQMFCNKCGYGKEPDPISGRPPWGVESPDHAYRCPECGSIDLGASCMEEGKPKTLLSEEEWDKLAGAGPMDSRRTLSYDLL
jgi:hypothetical protein